MGSDGSVLDGIVVSAVEFVDAWAAHERDAARLALAARRLEACGDWAHDGSVSMTAWLRHHCRMSNRDAAALVHRGRFLDKFTAIAEAACDGVLSAGQVNALRTVTKPAVESVMAAQQGEIVAIIAPLAVADAEQAAGLWRQRAEAIVDLCEPVEPERELRFARTVDGLVGRFVLDDNAAVQFEQAIRTASTWDGKSDEGWVAPLGVYFAHLEGEAGRRSERKLIRAQLHRLLSLTIPARRRGGGSPARRCRSASP